MKRERRPNNEREGQLVMMTVVGLPPDDLIRRALLIQVLPPTPTPKNVLKVGDLLEALEGTGPCLWETPETDMAAGDCLALIVGIRTVQELRQLQEKIRRIKTQ